MILMNELKCCNIVIGNKFTSHSHIHFTSQVQLEEI